MQKKLILIILAVGVIGASVWGYTKYKGGDEKPQIVKATVTRGDIVEAVRATGTLEALTTVQVGTQVSGTVQALYADFNHIVKKGQVIARLDPSLIQTQIEQQAANVTRAEADLERLKVGLQDAKVKLGRAQELEKRQLIARTELEAAEMAVKTQESSIRSSEAGLSQAKANLNQQRVNLNHTVITAPIDGIVISRNVDEGQTVAASMNAPVLYLLAADPTKMKISANIDEADVGKIRPGQRTTFRVDAFPTGNFEGTVMQVRLNPVTVQNVVTYAAVIEVPNPDYRLKPGMTANVDIEIARRDNVLRVPAGALRFRPTNDTFAALKQEVPPEMTATGRGGNRGGQQGGQTPGGQTPGGQTAAPAGGNAQPGAQQPARPNTAAQPPAARNNAPRQGGSQQGQTAENRGGGDTGRAGGEGRRGGFGNLTPEQRAERQRQMEERMKSMTPEERAAFQERLQRGQQGGGRGQGGANSAARNNTAPSGGRGQGAGQSAAAPIAPSNAGSAQTIDALFAPLQTTTQRGRVWVLVGTEQQPQIKAINVRTGVTDGQWAELLEGELTEGQEIVTGIILPNAQAQVPGTTGGNPLMGPQRGGQPGRGNPGGNTGRGR